MIMKIIPVDDDDDDDDDVPDYRLGRPTHDGPNIAISRLVVSSSRRLVVSSSPVVTNYADRTIETRAFAFCIRDEVKKQLKRNEDRELPNKSYCSYIATHICRNNK
jgi:hypothetical protein